MTDELRGLRVWIVEDEFLVLLDLQTVFEDAGAEVVTAASVEQGLALLDNEPLPDVALLDVRLADGEVFPLARALTRRGVPVVFHSGHAQVSDLAAAFPGARALPKPAPESALLAAVSEARGAELR